MIRKILGASLLALAVAAPSAHAYEAGDLILRAGAVTVDPHEDSGNLHVNGGGVGGTKATLDSDTQLGLNFAVMLTDHWGLELLAATPFQHSVGVQGLPIASLNGNLAAVRQLPPTVSVVDPRAKVPPSRITSAATLMSPLTANVRELALMRR